MAVVMSENCRVRLWKGRARWQKHRLRWWERLRRRQEAHSAVSLELLDLNCPSTVGNGRAHYPPSSSILPPFSKSAAVANFCHLCPPQRIRPPWRPRLPILGGASGLGSYILWSSKTIGLRINNVMGWKLSLWAGRQVGK